MGYTINRVGDNTAGVHRPANRVPLDFSIRPGKANPTELSRKHGESEPAARSPSLGRTPGAEKVSEQNSVYAAAAAAAAS